MVWCEFCKDERFYALVKLIREKIKFKEKQLKKGAKEFGFSTNYMKYLEHEILALKEILRELKDFGLDMLSERELKILEKKNKLWGI